METEQRKKERTYLSVPSLIAFLDLLETLSRKDVEAIYMKSKQIVSAGVRNASRTSAKTN